jgi:hypothetical protein
MFVFVEDDDLRSRLAELRVRADDDRLGIGEVSGAETGYTTSKDDLAIASRFERLRAQLSDGHTVGYSVEERYPDVFVRHIWVTYAGSRAGRGPHPEIIDIAMKILGFNSVFDQAHQYLEELSNGSYAVHALEPLDGDWSSVPSVH